MLRRSLDIQHCFSDVKHVPWKRLQITSHDDDISRCKFYKVSELVCLVKCSMMFWLFFWLPVTFIFTLLTHTICLCKCLWKRPIHISRQPNWQVVLMVFTDVGWTLQSLHLNDSVSAKAGIIVLQRHTLTSLWIHAQKDGMANHKLHTLNKLIGWSNFQSGGGFQTGNKNYVHVQYK